jgi:hypothetical protein
VVAAYLLSQPTHHPVPTTKRGWENMTAKKRWRRSIVGIKSWILLFRWLLCPIVVPVVFPWGGAGGANALGVMMDVWQKTTTATTTPTIQETTTAAPSPSGSSSRSSANSSVLHHGAHAWISSSSSSSFSSSVIVSTTNENKDASTAFASDLDNDTWMSLYDGNKEDDTVVRIFDDDSQKRKFLIQLEKNGIVALAGIQVPTVTTTTTNEYPAACISNTPASKLRQLVPPRSRVQIYKIQTKNTTRKNNKITTVILQKQPPSTPNDNPVQNNNNNKIMMSVNAQLVQLGYAQVRNQQARNNNDDAVLERMIPTLVAFQQQAMQHQLGIYRSCSTSSTNENPLFVAEFEDYTDPNEETTTTTKGMIPPPNPGDTVGCSDFETYEDSLRYYERYFPYYGDVARLDRNGDGIPCPKLPHTNNREQYRIKKPTRNVQ